MAAAKWWRLNECPLVGTKGAEATSMMISDVMTPYPETLGPDATIQKAALLMRDHDYGVIPVVDESGVLVGIVTDRDIVVQAIAQGHGPETPLSECMTVHPDTVPKDLPIDKALHVMNTRQIRRLPVVENGRLIGIVSFSDIATSGVPEGEKVKTLESLSTAGGELRRGAGLPES